MKEQIKSVKKLNKHGETLEVDGEKVNTLIKENIGEETKQLLKDGKIQEYLARIHDIDLEEEED